MYLFRPGRLIVTALCVPLLVQGCAAYRAYDHDPRYRASVDRTAAHVERLHAEEMRRRTAGGQASGGGSGWQQPQSYQSHAQQLDDIRRRSAASQFQSRQHCLRQTATVRAHMGC